MDWSRITANPLIKWEEQTLSIFQERLENAREIEILPLEV